MQLCLRRGDITTPCSGPGTSNKQGACLVYLFRLVGTVGVRVRTAMAVPHIRRVAVRERLAAGTG